MRRSGVACTLVRDIRPAGDVVRDIAEEAVHSIQRVTRQSCDSAHPLLVPSNSEVKKCSYKVNISWASYRPLS
jgi:hypothetical protein